MAYGFLYYSGFAVTERSQPTQPFKVKILLKKNNKKYCNHILNKVLKAGGLYFYFLFSSFKKKKKGFIKTINKISHNREDCW